MLGITAKNTSTLQRIGQKIGGKDIQPIQSLFITFHWYNSIICKVSTDPISAACVTPHIHIRDNHVSSSSSILGIHPAVSYCLALSAWCYNSVSHDCRSTPIDIMIHYLISVPPYRYLPHSLNIFLFLNCRSIHILIYTLDNPPQAISQHVTYYPPPYRARLHYAPHRHLFIMLRPHPLKLTR